MNQDVHNNPILIHSSEFVASGLRMKHETEGLWSN